MVAEWGLLNKNHYYIIERTVEPGLKPRIFRDLACAQPTSGHTGTIEMIGLISFTFGYHTKAVSCFHNRIIRYDLAPGPVKIINIHAQLVDKESIANLCVALKLSISSGK